jgi:RimJ/RimL family protein N-acetyltransferase
MKEFPVLLTQRLILSQLNESDIPFIVEYLQQKIFSDLTSNIPYPYTEKDAESWLEMSREAFIHKTGYTFAIRDKQHRMMGAVGIHDRGDNKAELGYWLAVPFWSKGYVTEAAKAIIDFGFETLKLNKIYATHFLNNPASGRIMQKIGMEKEALLKQHVKKEEDYLDILMYSLFKKKD